MRGSEDGDRTAAAVGREPWRKERREDGEGWCERGENGADAGVGVGCKAEHCAARWPGRGGLGRGTDSGEEGKDVGKEGVCG